jgi:hypothetical protein
MKQQAIYAGDTGRDDKHGIDCRDGWMGALLSRLLPPLVLFAVSAIGCGKDAGLKT